MRSLIFCRVNYSKPPCGLARFNVVYPWFKKYHFTYLRFKTLTDVTHLAQLRKKKEKKKKNLDSKQLFSQKIEEHRFQIKLKKGKSNKTKKLKFLQWLFLVF
jgi:hypothetical protein